MLGFNVSAVLAEGKRGAMEYGVAGAGALGAFWAAKMAAEKLATMGQKFVKNADGTMSLDPSVPAADNKPWLPAWAPPLVVGALGIAAAWAIRRYMPASQARLAARLSTGVGVASLAYAGAATIKHFADQSTDPKSMLKTIASKIPLAGLGESTGLAIGYLRGAPVSIQQLNGAPMSIQQLRGLGLPAYQVSDAAARSANYRNATRAIA